MIKNFEFDHKTGLIVNDAVYNGYLDQMDEYQRFHAIAIHTVKKL